MAAHSHIHKSKIVVNTATWMMAENFFAIIKKPEWKEFMKNFPELLDDIHEKLAGAK